MTERPSVYIAAGGLLLAATVVYASYVCRESTPTPCNTHYVNESVQGHFTCASPPGGHNVAGSGLVTVIPTRPWYDHVDTGQLNKAYVEFTCKFGLQLKWWYCHEHAASTLTTGWKNATETAVSLSDECPP